MANKRMFSSEIVKSDAFLAMPLSTRCLYFHLGMEADDRGFIGNPMTVLKYTGAAQDDMNLLILKGFVMKCDNGVILVKHWLIHNYIPPDRFHETNYTEQLDCVYVKQNKSYTFDENKAVYKLSANENKPVYRNKSSLNETKLNKYNKYIKKMLSNKHQQTENNYDSEMNEVLKYVCASYNSICSSFQEVERLTNKRKAAIVALFQAGYELADVIKLFQKTAESEYFNSLPDDSWRPTFDWLIKEDNVIAVLEGKYDKKFVQALPEKPKSTNKFNNFHQRQYDMDNLEKALLNTPKEDKTHE